MCKTFKQLIIKTDMKNYWANNQSSLFLFLQLQAVFFEQDSWNLYQWQQLNVNYYYT